MLRERDSYYDTSSIFSSQAWLDSLMMSSSSSSSSLSSFASSENDMTIFQRLLSANSDSDFEGTFDTLTGIGMALMVVPIAVWYICARKQYDKYLKQSTLRLQLISVRLSLFLPAYALWIWISLISPDVGVIMELASAITEAMSFWGLFALIVENFGGPDKTLVVLSNSYHSPCLCCQSNHAAFYRRLHHALQYVLWIRCPLTIVLIIFEIRENRTAIIAITLIGLAILANAFVSLITFFHAVYEHTKNIAGLPKLILLKLSVVLIVLQGLIVQIICLAGHTRLTDDEAFTSRGKTFRIYYTLVLIEFVLLSIFYYNAYSYEMLPSPNILDKYEKSGQDPNQRPNITFEDFLYQSCIRVDDVFYYLRPTQGPHDSLSDVKGLTNQADYKNPMQQY